MYHISAHATVTVASFLQQLTHGVGRAYLSGPHGAIVTHSRFDADSCGYIQDPVRRLFGLCGLSDAFHHDSRRVHLHRLPFLTSSPRVRVVQGLCMATPRGARGLDTCPPRPVTGPCCPRRTRRKAHVPRRPSFRRLSRALVPAMVTGAHGPDTCPPWPTTTSHSPHMGPQHPPPRTGQINSELALKIPM